MANVLVPLRNTLTTGFSALGTPDFGTTLSNRVYHPEIARVRRTMEESAFAADDSLTGSGLSALWTNSLFSALAFAKRRFSPNAQVERIPTSNCHVRECL